MDPIVTGALIGAGANVLGGLFGKKSAERGTSAQMEMAKHGISWRVADAKRAGIHPLAALGLPLTSFVPQRVGGDWIGKAGQQVGAAVSASLERKERIENRSRELRLADAEIRNRELHNQILEKDLLGSGQGGSVRLSGPAVLDSSGDGGVPPGQGGIIVVPKQVKSSSVLGIETGSVPMEQMVHTDKGYFKLKPTQELSEPLESSWFDQGDYIRVRSERLAKAVWYYHNPQARGAAEHRAYLRRIRPKAGRGYEYRFNPWRGFKLYKKVGSGQLYEKRKESIAQRYRKTRKGPRASGIIHGRRN